ncbi:MAG TPA: hypothetical protein VIV15_02080 [Anaerolineales bacterium]
MALGIFALFIVTVDTVFSGVNRGARKAQLADDVQQNGRIAVERLTREIREASTSNILVGGSVGSMWVLFKTARLQEDNRVFCLYTRTTEFPYDSRCFTFPGGNLSAPPYGAAPASPSGTFAPIWQQYVGYYVTTTGGVTELRRVAGQLNTSGVGLASSMVTGGEVIAAQVETFDVSVGGGTIVVTLKSRGTEVVQGTQQVPQEMLLPGTVLIRN